MDLRNLSSGLEKLVTLTIYSIFFICLSSTGVTAFDWASLPGAILDFIFPEAEAPEIGYDVDAPRINPNVDEAVIGQFPWMAVIYHVGVMKCGGSIISSRWVLTAGHCVVPHIYGDIFYVLFGAVDRSSIDLNFQFGGNLGLKMTTHISALHPDFSYYSDGSVDNDIGLLFMLEDIPFGATIQPLPLATEADDQRLGGRLGITIGWGRTPSNRDVRYLHYAKVPFITNRRCSDDWGDQIGDRKICTTDHFSPCNGDSGSPLVLEIEGGGYVQVGIVSYGISECSPNIASVYTRVNKFTAWIQTFIVQTETVKNM